MRIVFMGTPEFAVPSLKALAGSRHEIAAVVTQPDRPKGRGQVVSVTPVKREAQGLGLSLIQPENTAGPVFAEHLAALKADCFLVVGFTILPEAIVSLPPRGSVNLHASLLPLYRGAAPIQWAIINGETRTGVTTFFIRKKVDTGDIILQHEIEIGEKENAGMLHDRLAEAGAVLLLKTADLIDGGKVPSAPQAGTATAAPKILPEHRLIQWEKNAVVIMNLIRGLSPRPGAYTTFGKDRLKILRASLLPDDAPGAPPPGTVVECGRRSMIVQTGKGRIALEDVQPENGGCMNIVQFLCGRSVQAGCRMGETDRPNGRN
jgi:methionyl-tRNA formyltransferase